MMNLNSNHTNHRFMSVSTEDDIRTFNMMINEDIRTRMIYKVEIEFQNEDSLTFIRYLWNDSEPINIDEIDDEHIITEQLDVSYKFDKTSKIFNDIIKRHFLDGLRLVSFVYQINDIISIKWYDTKQKTIETNKSTVKRRKRRVIDRTSMVVELPRFNQNAFEYGNAYFLKMKSVDKAMALLKYKHHCDDKINSWIPECHLDDIAKSLEYGVYTLFKDITYQGTLITFFVAYRSIGTDTNKKCVELSIPIDAIDDIEITKLDIDAFDRKENKNED